MLKKKSFGEFVKLTANEHTKLVERFGESAVREMIEILDNYKGAHGRKYISDYRAILCWVVKAFKERRPKNNYNKSKKALQNWVDRPFLEVLDVK